ncbi:helix-turn-helix domain-containing protein [Phototrophicus methaneseepsis]|uniref:Helix-turn-helix domain-containing protein n=1 Tax=Phototrophicus methaneseepsis TaxID=2710758 RepID=A0A7S8IDF0_9CHLR|nr:helix-turn-helix transcriptional regulator [Phototrophicus methaneseepsis]QPC81299.1 helix-turn-helix domain-containing protein [Phototrophicus methaneseepsis]
MHRIQKLLQDECVDVLSFGDALSDILYEKDLTQSMFAQQIGYSDSVVSRLITKPSLPRWVNYQQIARIAHILECTESQTGRLVAAFICTVMKMQGLNDEKI